MPHNHNCVVLIKFLTGRNNMEDLYSKARDYYNTDNEEIRLKQKNASIEFLNTCVEFNYEIQAVENILKLLSQTINLPYYSVLQIFSMKHAEKLATRYYGANYDENLFINTTSDLKYRMLECKDMV